MGAMVRSELTFSVQILDEEGKLSQIFIFTLLCGASKGFMKAFKLILSSSGIVAGKIDEKKPNFKVLLSISLNLIS